MGTGCLFIQIWITIWASGAALKPMDMEHTNIFKEWFILEAGKMIISMDRVSSFGKTELFLRESFTKVLKSMESLVGQTDPLILDNLIKIDYKERESLFIRMVDTITVNGKTT